jgi:hypothetical protein
MDHNDKRNTNVPLGTFAVDAADADLRETTPSHPGSAARPPADDNQVDDNEVTHAYVNPAKLAGAKPADKPADVTLHEGMVAEAHSLAEEHTPILFGKASTRQRVPTLLGVPLVDLPEIPRGVPAKSHSLARSGPRAEVDAVDTDASISTAIAEMLDDQLSIAVEIDEDDDSPLAVVADADITELPDQRAVLKQPASSDASSSGPNLPLLIPSQYAAAQTDRLPQPDANEATQPRRVVAALPAAVGGVIASAAASATSVAPPAASLPPAAVSSLAPREVVRRLQPAPTPTRESSSTAGWLAVAAVALIAVGGWFFTAGSFNRATVSQAPAPPNAPAAASQPMAALPDSVTERQPTAAPSVIATPAPEAPSADDAHAQTSAAPKLGLAGKGKSLTASSRALRVKQPSQSKVLPSDMPEAPSRGEVLQSLETVRSSVRACAAGRSGVADLDITIAHSGVVTHVLVGGDFAGTTQGSCIARAVRDARFASFKQERFRLLFPYAI